MCDKSSRIAFHPDWRKFLFGLSVVALTGGVQALTLRVDEDRALTADEKSALNGGGETELVKEGAGVLTTDGLTGFKGTITVRPGGAIRIANANGLGMSGTVVNIESGSSLLVYNEAQNMISLAGVEVRIAGSGHDGEGAVQLSGKDQNYLFYKLTLTDDARIGGTKKWGSINTGSGSIVDFGGHTLTNATGCMWRFGQMLNPGHMIQAADSIQATDGCGFIGGDAHEFVLDGGTLSLYDWRIPCTWTLHVKRTTNVHPGSGTDKELSNVWSGPTILDEGVAFGVGSSAAQTKGFQMTLGGRVSGEGKLVVYNFATVNLSSENAFTGGVAMGNNGSICAAVDGALPVIGGRATLPALTASCRVYLHAKSAGNPSGWTAEHLAQYLESSICNNCVIDTPEDERIDLGAPASCYNALQSTGAGFSFEGSGDAASPVVIATNFVRRGLLTLNGGFFSFHDENLQGGTVGVMSDYGVTPVARLVFGENYRGVLNGASTPRLINIGCTPGTVGIADIRGGAVLTNGFSCGVVAYADSSNMKDGQIAAGAIYQRGGEVAAVEKTSVNLADNGGYGYYELQQGGLYANYPMSVGGRKGIGIFQQNGGEWKMGANSVTLGSGGTGVVYQAAGTLATTTQDISLGNTSGTGSQETFHPFANWTIAGAAQTETRNFFGGAHSNFKSYLNLIDGGTLYANNIHKRETGYLPSDSAVTELFNNDFYVNFNGGVFRRRLQDSLFDADHLPTRVTVYPKGAIFQVDGSKDTLAYISAPLLAPGAGKGVAAVVCPGTTDYIGAPFVDIVGDGHGATAVALFDVEKNAVTNVVVTSPGWGYTEASAVFTGGGRKGSVTTACALDDVSGGGLVKRGSGILELRSVNTYSGPTIVEAGILRQTVEGAIPAGTKLVLQQGATLDLNHLATTFSGVDGTGGAVKNGDLVLTGALELSARKFIDRETTAFDGVLDLTGVVQLKLTDTEALTEAALTLRSFYLLKATSIRYPAKPFELIGVPDRWKLSCTSTGIKLAPDRGLCILVR